MKDKSKPEVSSESDPVNRSLDQAPLFLALLRLRPGGSGVLNYVDHKTSQFLVHRGTWMGASSLGDWTLLACWCSPAFRPEHFELGDRTLLTAGYPSYAAEIAALTRDEPVGRMR